MNSDVIQAFLLLSCSVEFVLAFLKQLGRADLPITNSGNVSDSVMFEQTKAVNLSCLFGIFKLILLHFPPWPLTLLNSYVFSGINL